MSKTEKPRWPLKEALAVAAQIRECIGAFVFRIEVAGSIRREKPMVGDIELLYIPLCVSAPDRESLIGETITENVTDRKIAELERSGVLARRKNSLGREAFGEKNKLMVHVPTGIPVDLFAATEDNWFNYLVCRTGGAENNVEVASAAQRMGWKWNPYGAGFSRSAHFVGTALLPDAAHRVTSERGVYEFVGLPYREPRFRR